MASLGFNVRLLDVRLMKMFAASLTKFEVTPAEATVLHVIMANPDVSHGELAETLLIQLPNMTKMLKRLEAEGLSIDLPQPEIGAESFSRSRPKRADWFCDIAGQHQRMRKWRSLPSARRSERR